MSDKFEYLPGSVSELQDGGLQISESTSAPITLVLGTSESGTSGKMIPVVRAQESEQAFGKSGTLIRGMYEAKAGGSTNTMLYRINTRSAILYGVGTDDQELNPTFIETAEKDASAGDNYLLKYTSPATLGGTIGQLIVKDSNDNIVYDNNPGGQVLNTGSVVVSGSFTGGEDIDEYVSFTEAAALVFEKVLDGGLYDDVNGSDVAVDENATIVSVYINSVLVDSAEYTFVDGTLAINAGLGNDGEAIEVNYTIEPLSIRSGSDGLNPSRMELYEALDEAYRSLESENIDIIIPQNVYLDDKNVVDGDSVVLSSDVAIPAGQRYPIAGTPGDALGKVYVEEYEGEFFYFWDINLDGQAEIYPSVGLASATTKIDGSALSSDDFQEVNFAYQLANFCFVLSVYDNEVDGVIGVRPPRSSSRKDIAFWIGKEPTLDSDGKIIVNGSGLLGNKFLAGKVNQEPGFFATYSGFIPSGANLETDPNIITDRNGHRVDIGKYISIAQFYLTYYNPIDTTGYGYAASMAAYYAGFISTLPSKISPLNKELTGVSAPIKISKTKLNLLSKYKYVSVKEKGGVLRFSDAATAAKNDSDYQRLTTKRITKDCVDAVRLVANPYIGGPNTAVARASMETGIQRELAALQEDGTIQRFQVRVSATRSQTILGETLVELVFYPALEMRKVRIITSLAA